MSEKGKGENKIRFDITAYVSGCFNETNGMYGYGVLLVDDGQIIQRICGGGKQPEYAAISNVAGEIIAAQKAIEYGISHDYVRITVCSGYTGVKAWGTGAWKAKRESTRRYVRAVSEYRKQIDISFQGIGSGRSSKRYSRKAAALARKGSGAR